jgi:alpha-tubulin suppressor-like RCC1 family protein
MPLNEGQTVQYTVVTTRVADGTVLYWKTTGNTTNSDIVGGNTGTITITNNRAYINVTPSLDLNTDGTKTLGIALLTGSLNGTQVTTTASEIVVNDTSVPPIVKLFTWGLNDSGQLSLNDTITRSSPTQVGTNTNWTNLAPGGLAATKSDGTLWIWGSNDFGSNKSSPTQVSGTTWNRLGSQTMATKTDGTLWLWGNNTYGQLGQNNRVSTTSPVQVAGTTWNKIAGEGQSRFAIKTDGTLWAWGSNYSGQLGNGLADRYSPFQSRSSPIQVGSNTNWNEIVTSTYSVLATKTDGTLWAWGAGNGGVLGQNNTTYRSSPVQVGTDTTWSKITMNSSTSLAIKTDGTLWAWGANDWGQLGQNNTTYRSSPVQVGATTNWSEVNIGDVAVIAVKTDGTLWTWGFNRNGVLGNNDWQPFNGGNKSSPVQLGTNTNWSVGRIGNNGFAHAITFRD